jgi:hypothetical protein
MVDRHERQLPRPGDRFRCLHTDEQGADQAGTARYGDAFHVVERRARLLERLAHDGYHELEVATRRNLGNDAAVARM